MNSLGQELQTTISRLHAKTPLIYMIPNAVTESLCADGIAAIGARPVMAVAPEEAAEIVSSAEALIVNMGQPTVQKQSLAEIAIKSAIQREKPVLLDPVGIGASSYRMEMIKELSMLPFRGIIKGNYSEIIALASKVLNHNGVDNSYPQIPDLMMLKSVQQLLQDKDNSEKVIVMTGSVDFVITAEKIIRLEKDAKPLITTAKVVGMGCLAGAIMGSMMAVTDCKTAAEHGLLLMSQAIQEAKDRAISENVLLYGSFKYHLLNRLSNHHIDCYSQSYQC